MAFRGSLAELPLTDILQLVAVSNKTGMLAMRNGEARGEIHVDRGQIVHAATGALGGEQAFYEMARWNAGEFDFTQDAPVAARTIEISNTNLMMEAARQIDEWKLLAKKIGSTRMVPVFAPRVASSVSLSALEWSVVSRVDEHRNLEEIAAALGQSTFDVCKIVYGLLAAGTIALREDLRRLPIERVRRLSPAEQGRLAGQIQRAALELVDGRDHVAELEGALRLCRAEQDSGRALDGLLDLVRAAEKTVSTALGPHQARAFLDRVTLLLGGGESEREAPRQPAPAPPRTAAPAPRARFQRGSADLAAVRQHFSELVYRGLGPDGERHVLRIENARSLDDVLVTAATCRDLLRRLGKEELAGLLDAEIASLA
jgi:hypothetical protein